MCVCVCVYYSDFPSLGSLLQLTLCDLGIFFVRGSSLPLLPTETTGDEGVENTDGGADVVGGGAEEDEEAFFDAVEVSIDEWVKSKSVSFKPTGAAVVGGGEDQGGGGEGGGEVKFGHKRNASAISVNDAQQLLSSPEPDQLPSCSERTMSVSPIVSQFENEIPF